MQLPDRAQVVIIGGGVIGSSVAYHLTQLGWSDVVLIERDRLTSGTTWHAAGLIVSGGMTTETSAWMSKYTRELYEGLEEETGVSTGFRPVGYVQTGASPDRIDKLRREADFLRCVGIEREEISPDEVKELWPMLDTSDLIAGFYTANEGRADPANCAMSLAKGARLGGVKIFEETPVVGFILDGGRVTGVRTIRGDIRCEHVVNCGGMWARQIGEMAGVAVPLQAAEHAYLITDQFESVSSDMPILEDPDRFAYYREETGGLMVGLFEPVGAPWSVEGVPDDFSFGHIENDWDRLAPYLELAMEPFPILEQVGIRHLFTGPESFTPDNGSLIGPAPEVENFWVAAGFNSLGILLGEARERSWRTGSSMVRRPWTSPRSTSPGYTPSRPHAVFAKPGPWSCWAGSTPPVRGRIHTPNRLATRDGRCSTTASWPRAHISASPLGGRTPPGLLLPARRSRSRRHTGDTGGGNITKRSITPPATTSCSLTCLQCPTSWLKARTLRGSSIISAAMTWRSSREGASTRSG